MPAKEKGADMSSSKQTKFSGTKAAGISILALCLLAFSQLLALLIGNMLVAGEIFSLEFYMWVWYLEESF